MQRQNLRSIHNTRSSLSFKSAVRDIHTPQGRYVLCVILVMSIMAFIFQKVLVLVADENIAFCITLGIVVVSSFCAVFKMDKILKVISRRQLEKFNRRLKNRVEADRSDA